jgi:UPF0042 nucleotide-binding protein
MALTLISFGYLLGPPPEADRAEDVRRRLRDPAAARTNGILDVDGRDERVQQVVLGTPGAAELVDNLVAAYAILHSRDRTLVMPEHNSRIMRDISNNIVSLSRILP